MRIEKKKKYSNTILLGSRIVGVRKNEMVGRNVAPISSWRDEAETGSEYKMLGNYYKTQYSIIMLKLPGMLAYKQIVLE